MSLPFPLFVCKVMKYLSSGVSRSHSFYGQEKEHLLVKYQVKGKAKLSMIEQAGSPCPIVLSLCIFTWGYNTWLATVFKSKSLIWGRIKQEAIAGASIITVQFWNSTVFPSHTPAKSSLTAVLSGSKLWSPHPHHWELSQVTEYLSVGLWKPKIVNGQLTG